MKRILLLLATMLVLEQVSAQKSYQLLSPNGELKTTISLGEELTYSIEKGDEVMLNASPLALHLMDGTTLGKRARVQRAVRQSVDQTIESPLYHTARVRDHYNALTLRMKGEWSVEFRAYDEGVAYRFVTHRKKPFEIRNEQVEYRFAKDLSITTPYVRRGRDSVFTTQFFHEFENLYTTKRLSRLNPYRLSFLPLVAHATPSCNILLTEVNLESYPGLYMVRDTTQTATLKGVFAPYPAEEQVKKRQIIVSKAEPYIARVEAPRTFPWRVAIFGTDLQLAVNDLTWLLAEPSRIADLSWIKSGKAAWDWWSARNLEGVDFRAGINTETYKYYIDFAAQYGIEYLLIDDGWYDRKSENLFQIQPQVDLPAILEYGRQKGVDILLWASYKAFHKEMERICRHYAAMGVKGFKVDLMDRDDQKMTGFNYRAAEMTAKYHLILDLHGTYKPAGLNRTWPNVLNVEGVNGMENMKFGRRVENQMTYDVMLPFIRQVAGPMDYTPGAMINATKRDFHLSRRRPMSQGTRCHQLALYIVLESPLNMLCDTPSHYLREKESMEFLSAVPTVWDETRVLAGKMGKYVVMARRKGNRWFVGGLTNWTARDLKVDLSSLASSGSKVILYRDGINADRKATDYKRELLTVSEQPLQVHLAPGGGFAAIIE